MNSNFIWGYTRRGHEIKKILTENNIEIAGIIDKNKNISDECMDFETFMGKYDVNKCTFFLGTLRQDIEKEMTDTIRRFSDEATIYGIYEFHNDFERPYFLNENNGYHVDFMRSFDTWLDNVSDEVLFWDKEVVSEAGAFHKEYAEWRIKPKKFACGRLKNFKIHDKTNVLDVGCGVCTKYGSILDDGEIDLTGIDPLAYVYNKLNKDFLKKYEKTDAVPPEVTFGLFEFMHIFREKQTADVILIDNALDHCIDPIQALFSCFYVLKVDGCLSLSHSVDESLHAGKMGLHQWNIACSESRDLIIWNDKQYFNVTEALCEYAEIDTYVQKDERWGCIFGIVTCNITKKKEIPKEWLLGGMEAGKIIEILMEKFLEKTVGN